MRPLLVVCLLMGTFAPAAWGQEGYDRREDVIYGRTYGTALTMDVFRPDDANGLGLIYVVSGGWYSSDASINAGFARPFLERGYTVFAVVHGSQPKFTIPEILKDMHRATRYIRHHAEDYQIDPERIGIYGGSAGGHLSLMQGLAGTQGDPMAEDPIERESSRVQAVACFFPPTDFLNYGKEGQVALGTDILKDFRAPFDFQELKLSEGSRFGKTFEPITERSRRLKIGREISPVNHVSEDDPPVLIMHGDADELVPIQQAELLVAALKDADVKAELVVNEGAAHGWATMGEDLERFADWFDETLKRDE